MKTSNRAKYIDGCSNLVHRNIDESMLRPPLARSTPKTVKFCLKIIKNVQKRHRIDSLKWQLAAVQWSRAPMAMTSSLGRKWQTHIKLG